MTTLLLTLDLLGTFVFALAGATAGARRQLDVLGIAVLSFATACSGGIARDVLIGAFPPAALSDWRYTAASLLATIVAFDGIAHRAHAQSSASIRCRRARAVAVTGTHKALPTAFIQ